MNFGYIIFHGNRGIKQVALTFDDSPSDETSQLLKLLKKEKIKATFFVVGRRIIGRERIIKKMIKELSVHRTGLKTDGNLAEDCG